MYRHSQFDYIGAKTFLKYLKALQARDKYRKNATKVQSVSHPKNNNETKDCKQITPPRATKTSRVSVPAAGSGQWRGLLLFSLDIYCGAKIRSKLKITWDWIPFWRRPFPPGDFFEQSLSFGLGLDKLGALLREVVRVLHVALLQVVLSQEPVGFRLLVPRRSISILSNISYRHCHLQSSIEALAHCTEHNSLLKWAQDQSQRHSTQFPHHLSQRCCSLSFSSRMKNISYTPRQRANVGLDDVQEG